MTTSPEPREWALACELPEECPLGPEPHEYLPPGTPGGLVCCRQPWEQVRA